MLAYVVSIVAREYYICVIQKAGGFETRDDSLYNLIYCLKSLQTSSVERIIVFNERLIQAFQMLDPRYTARLAFVSLSLSSYMICPPTFLGLKFAFRGILTSGNKCLCRSAGIGVVMRAASLDFPPSPPPT